MKKSKVIMKKVISVCLAVVVCIGLFGTVVEAASKGYVFKYKKVSVSMNGKAATLIKKAGTANKVTKKKSCAYKGLDRTYTYDDFILKTYSKSKSGKEYVSSISFVTSKVSTKEGIKIGSTKKQMIKAYGKNNGEFGVYIYNKGKSKIMIELNSNDKVSKIEYVAK